VANPPIDAAALATLAEPTERAQRALVAMEDARTLIGQLAQTRARAVYELYQEHGASKAARLLGINRVNLYRIIRELPEVRAAPAPSAPGPAKLRSHTEA
jgi:transcriptional regulator with PAS, ATPase and Fis domain